MFRENFGGLTRLLFPKLEKQFKRDPVGAKPTKEHPYPSGFYDYASKLYEGKATIVNIGASGYNALAAYVYMNDDFDSSRSWAPALKALGVRVELSIVLFGTNDGTWKEQWPHGQGGSRLSVKEYKENLGKIVFTLQKMFGCAIIVLSPPPVGTPDPDKDGSIPDDAASPFDPSRILQYADASRKVAEEFGTAFVDLCAVFAEKSGNKREHVTTLDFRQQFKDAFMIDPAHYGTRGQIVVREEIMRVIRERYPHLAPENMAGIRGIPTSQEFARQHKFPRLHIRQYLLAAQLKQFVVISGTPQVVNTDLLQLPYHRNAASFSNVSIKGRTALQAEGRLTHRSPKLGSTIDQICSHGFPLAFFVSLNANPAGSQGNFKMHLSSYKLALKELIDSIHNKHASSASKRDFVAVVILTPLDLLVEASTSSNLPFNLLLAYNTAAGEVAMEYRLPFIDVYRLFANALQRHDIRDSFQFREACRKNFFKLSTESSWKMNEEGQKILTGGIHSCIQERMPDFSGDRLRPIAQNAFGENNSRQEHLDKCLANAGLAANQPYLALARDHHKKHRPALLNF
ncbi:SGNH hydrolase [Meredithblackwellia eburnea MCA 4105]